MSVLLQFYGDSGLLTEEEALKAFVYVQRRLETENSSWFERYNNKGKTLRQIKWVNINPNSLVADICAGLDAMGLKYSGVESNGDVHNCGVSSIAIQAPLKFKIPRQPR